MSGASEVLEKLTSVLENAEREAPKKPKGPSYDRGSDVEVRPTPYRGEVGLGFQSGKIVRGETKLVERSAMAAYAGKEFKIFSVDHMTRQFTTIKTGPNMFFSFDDFAVQEERAPGSEPLDMSLPEVRLAELKKQQEHLELEVKAKAKERAALEAEKATKAKGYER